MNIDDMEGLDEETRQELKELQKVTREKDGNAFFAQAQLTKGNLLYENNKIKEALTAWYSISKNDIREIFIYAQWNISIVLMESDNLEEALSIWRSIKESDDSELYAQAQWNIGLSFDNAGNIGEAMRIWSYIEKTEDSSAYAVAQLNIGLILFDIGYAQSAIKIWSGIERSYNSEKYVKAKWMSGLALVTLNENKEALSEWCEIKATDGFDIYAQAQYKIGEILTNDSNLKNYTEAKRAFNNAEKRFPYEVYCYKKVCNLLLELDSESIGEKILLLLVNTLKIVEILKLDFNQDLKKEKSPERKLAHYTGTYITNLLLETDHKTDVSSSFRLNTINNVNDPSEGHLLINYLNDLKEGYFRAPDFDGKLHAFISCFTFNHDSLNQFRLYGKEADKEASGVSLVFGSNFFQSNESLRGLSFLSLENSLQGSDEEFIIEKNYEQSNVNYSSDDKVRINKQPVMRCVYLDPTSNYIQLAQRNRITFFREFGKEVVEVEGIKISKAEHEWEKYKDYINEKTKFFNNVFIILKGAYSATIEEKLKIQKDNSNLSDNIDILLNEILLPFKYLIKHSAFQEEQECRMIYITSINAPEVMMQHKKLLFVEYQAQVKENLNKVYIAPAATEYQLYLAWLLRNTDVKIELSNNPYRQT